MPMATDNSFDSKLQRMIVVARRSEPYNDVVDAIRDQHHRELKQAGGSSAKRRLARTRQETRLLEYIREPVFRWSEIRRGSELSGGQECAWHELCALGSVRFVPFLLKFERMRNGNIRPLAIRHLAWMGLDAHLPRVIRALRSDEPELVGNAIHGVDLAAQDRNVSAEYRRRTFDAIAPFLTGDRRLLGVRDAYTHLMNAPEALVRLDWLRARRLLTSDACLRPDNPAVLAVVAALGDFEGTRLPKPPPDADPSLIWPIYDAATRGKAAVPHRRMDQLRGEALKAAAVRDPERARTEAKAILKKKRKDRASLEDDARAAIRKCDEVPDPRMALQTLETKPRAFGLDATAVLRAFELADCVLGDGLATYLDSLGHNWKTARSGLELLGLHAAAKTLTEGALVFGRNGPPRDHTARLNASIALSVDQNARLESLSKRFMRSAHRVQREAEEYMRRRPEQFKPFKRR